MAKPREFDFPLYVFRLAPLKGQVSVWCHSCSERPPPLVPLLHRIQRLAKPPPGTTIRLLQRETQKTKVLCFDRRTSRCAGDAQCRVHFQPTWPSDILSFHRHSQSVFFPDMSLTGQNAVVVGGGTGMGEAIALGLANEGANVIVAGRRQAKLDEVAEKDEKISTQTADVADRTSVKALFDRVNDQFDQLHLLVNCAGANVPKRSMSELAPDDWDKLMNINATGAFNCMHYGLPLMRPHKTGLVINISSTSGKRAAPLGGVAYNASKFAMAALGTSATEDERGNGIRVTTIFPGEVDTPILDDRPVPPSAEHRATILKPADIADITLAVAKLPPLAHVPELVIKPICQSFI